MDYVDDCVERHKRKIAKNLLFDGRSDEEVMQVCEIDSVTLHDLIVELALETHGQMTEFRFVLNYLRHDDITVEERRGEVVKVICILKKLLYFWPPSKIELEDIIRRCQGFDENILKRIVEPLMLTNAPDYLLLTRGREILNQFYADMVYSYYRG